MAAGLRACVGAQWLGAVLFWRDCPQREPCPVPPSPDSGRYLRTFHSRDPLGECTRSETPGSCASRDTPTASSPDLCGAESSYGSDEGRTALH